MTVKDLARKVEAMEQELRELRDKEEIRRLKALYCNYLDGGWPEQGGTHMGPVADLFVEDGVWDASPGLPVAKGREAIATLFRELQAVPFVIHNALSPLIEIDGDTATGHWHFIGCGDMPGAGASWFIGTYDERYERTPDGWRYRLMKYTSVRQAPRPGGWVTTDEAGMAPDLELAAEESQ